MKPRALPGPGRFIPHRGPEPRTLIRDLSDLQSEKYDIIAQAFDAWYVRTAARLVGREPWAWSKLPGLGTAPGCMWQQQATPKSATEWRAWITSVRIDGGAYGFQCYITELFRARVEEGKLP